MNQTCDAIEFHPSLGPELLLCQGGARFQRVEDDADEEAFEAAERFPAAFAFAAFAFEVIAGGAWQRAWVIAIR